MHCFLDPSQMPSNTTSHFKTDTRPKEQPRKKDVGGELIEASILARSG